MSRLKRAALLVMTVFAVACGTLVDRNGASSAQVIGKTGGSLTAPSGVEIDVPAGALSSNTTIRIHPGVGLPAGALVAVEIGPSGTQFATPVTLSFPVPETTIPVERLKVMTVVDGKWVPLAGHDFNRETGMVSGKTTHLSPYALVSSDETCDNGGDDDGDGLVDCRDPACIGDSACPRTSCSANNQCAPNDYCRAGQCSPTGFCSLNADCGPDYFCLNSVCSAAGSCVTNAQCGAGGECWGGWCVSTRPDGGWGVTDGGSWGGNDGGYATDDGTWTGPVEEVDAGSYGCSSNADCGPGGYCYSGVCYVVGANDAGSYDGGH